MTVPRTKESGIGPVALVGNDFFVKKMPPAESVSPKMAAYQARLAAKRTQKWVNAKTVLWTDDLQLARDLESLANYVITLADRCPE